MAYARFLPDSDVYVFLEGYGAFECCQCGLTGGGLEHFKSTDDLLAHLREHTAAGHRVPDYCIEELEKDRAENDAWIAEVTA